MASFVSLVLAKPGELNYNRMQRKCYYQLHLRYMGVLRKRHYNLPKTNLFAMTSLNLIADKPRAISLEWSLWTELDWEIYSENLLHCFVVLSFVQTIN